MTIEMEFLGGPLDGRREIDRPECNVIRVPVIVPYDTWSGVRVESSAFHIYRRVTHGSPHFEHEGWE